MSNFKLDVVISYRLHRSDINNTLIDSVMNEFINSEHKPHNIKTLIRNPHNHRCWPSAVAGSGPLYNTSVYVWHLLTLGAPSL